MESIYRNFIESVAYAPFTGIAQTLEGIEPERGMGGGCIQMSTLLQSELSNFGYEVGTLHAMRDTHVTPFCINNSERFLFEPTCAHEEPISIDEVLDKGIITVDCYPHIQTNNGLKKGKLIVEVTRNNKNIINVSWQSWSSSNNAYNTLALYQYSLLDMTPGIIQLENKKYVHTFPRKENLIRLRFLDNGTFGYIYMNVIDGSLYVQRYNQPPIVEKNSPDLFLSELNTIAQQLNLTPEIILVHFQRAYDLLDHALRVQVLRKSYQQSLLSVV